MDILSPSEFHTLADNNVQALAEFVPQTPLQFSKYLSELHGASIWLKREDLSPVRSYKIRGAYSFFHEALKESDIHEFACASAGNHAQGFAHACRHFGKKGWIFMPVTTPDQKIEKTRAFGQEYVEIRLIGDTFDESNHEARLFCEERNAVFVPPFDHPRVILGQAGVAAEIINQMDEGKSIDRIIMPVGGGGLAAGVTTYLYGRLPRETFTFVEPDGAPSLLRSLEAGHPVQLAEMDNFVDGAAVGKIGDLTFEYLKDFSTGQVILAPTNGLCETMVELLNIEGIVLEPAGALSIDALKRLPDEQVSGKNIVCIVSGGNFDFERLPEVKERALKFAGLKKYFILQMPQRPGALKDFLFMLGPDDDISRFEYLKKSARNFGSVLIGIETTKPENFEVLIGKFDDAGMRFQDITENEIVANLVI